MKLRKIILNNIRTYENQEINFPDGSILLSGNIGSGKSTILLALEFALFGLQTGYLSGTSLLRNDKDSGSVEVELEVDGKIIKIKRSLKRSKKSVVQDKGIFAIDNVQEELGAEELKQRVLDLFGYPLSLIKARTNLLYRFTVYTPQEEMRQILQENAEQRIDVLRKIFGIDKYKKIAENTELIAARLREEARAKEGQIIDLPLLIEQKNEKEIELKEEMQKLQNILPQYNSTKNELKAMQEESEKILSKMAKVNELKQQLAAFNSELKIKENDLNELKEQILDTENEIKALESKINAKTKTIDEENISTIIKQKNQEQKNFLENLKNTEAQLIALELKKKEILLNKNKIESLEECPTCKQKVSSEHKYKIADNYNLQIKEIDSKFAELEKHSKEFSENLAVIEKELESLREKEKEYEKNKILLISLNEKRNFLTKLRKKEEEIAERLIILKNQKEKSEIELLAFKNIDVLALEVKQKLEVLRKKEREIEIEKVKHEKNIDSINKSLELLNENIAKKEKIVSNINQLKKLNEWLLKHYMEIILTIERTVMAKLNYEFNLLFEKWFKILVDNLEARIDENFTPIVEQQGFEINYEALSGGERTAAALAYRLALNQIINHFMGKLKTKGLLILDEPTDGFSSEQLEKMKDILNELEFEQLILVSHESEIEDFVENVINFEKKDGITKIY